MEMAPKWFILKKLRHWVGLLNRIIQMSISLNNYLVITYSVIY